MEREKYEPLFQSNGRWKKRIRNKISKNVTLIRFEILMRYYEFWKVKSDETNVSDVLITFFCYDELEFDDIYINYIDTRNVVMERILNGEKK